jgi:plasmid stabilization system protein ParE
MSRYVIAPSASRDLNKIADYFLPRNLEAGEKLFREFNKKCQKLANFPNIGRSYAHIKPADNPHCVAYHWMDIPVHSWQAGKDAHPTHIEEFIFWTREKIHHQNRKIITLAGWMP